jgi:3-hydroxyanthranilate 3,4-dioxygenase
MVIERKRLTHEKDGFLWLCPRCGDKLYEELIELKDLVRDLPPVFERFYGNAANCTCRTCGTRVTRS